MTFPPTAMFLKIKKIRASDFPFKKKKSISKKIKFRFDFVSLLPKMNSMKSQYIQRKQ